MTQTVYFGDLAEGLREKFYTYFAKYDTQFVQEGTTFTTVFRPPKNFGLEIRPKTANLKLIPQGALFKTLDVTRYAAIVLFVKNSQRQYRGATVEDFVPQSRPGQFYEDCERLCVFQGSRPRLSGFELLAGFFGSDYQRFVDFLLQVQIQHIRSYFARVLSTFVEQNLSGFHVGLFFDALRFLLQEFQVQQIEKLLKTNLPWAVVEKTAALYFAQYYDGYLLDELRLLERRNQIVTGNRLLFSMYELSVRFGKKCRRPGQNARVADLLQLSQMELRLVQADFENVFEAVLTQYAEGCRVLFNLDRVSYLKLVGEINAVVSVYLSLVMGEPTETYQNIVFIKKAEPAQLATELQAAKERLATIASRQQLFEFVRGILNAETLKLYFDAFVTSLIILQGR